MVAGMTSCTWDETYSSTMTGRDEWRNSTNSLTQETISSLKNIFYFSTSLVVGKTAGIKLPTLLKRLSIFPSPARMSLTNSSWPGIKLCH